MTKPWGVCADCGFKAFSLLEWTRHTDEHAGTPHDDDWYIVPSRRSYAQWDDGTAPVIFINEQTGEPRYPGRNDAVCPPGYRREHLRSLRAVEKFEKEQGVRSEMAWYDKGSGRGHDDLLNGERVTH